MSSRVCLWVALVGLVFVGFGCSQQTAPVDAPPDVPVEDVESAAKAPESAAKPAACCPVSPAGSAAKPAGSEAKPAGSAAKPAVQPKPMSSGKKVKVKMVALMEALKSNDLAKIKPAAQEACAAMGGHKAMDAKACAEPDYKAAEAEAIAGFQGAAGAATVVDAAKAAAGAKGACGNCHMQYKK